VKYRNERRKEYHYDTDFRIFETRQFLSTDFQGKVKVKQSRYRPEQAQRVDRGTALSFLDPGARRGWVSS
jgi:hypothetical protein